MNVLENDVIDLVTRLNFHDIWIHTHSMEVLKIDDHIRNTVVNKENVDLVGIHGSDVTQVSVNLNDGFHLIRTVNDILEINLQDTNPYWIVNKDYDDSDDVHGFCNFTLYSNSTWNLIEKDVDISVNMMKNRNHLDFINGFRLECLWVNIFNKVYINMNKVEMNLSCIRIMNGVHKMKDHNNHSDV